MSRDPQERHRWRTRPLGDVLVRHNDVIHPGERTGEATFVGLEHIEPNSGRRIGSQIIDLGSLTGRKPTFRRGQIVYGYLRPYLNKVWVAEFDGYSSVDQFAFDVRPELANTEFVAAFMRSETFLRRSSVVTTTGQLPRIGTEQIAAVPIELPPLDVQQRIATGVAEQLALAAVARRAAEERVGVLRSLSPAYLRSLFDRPEVKAAPRNRLGDVATKIGSGITPRGGQATYVESGIPLIRSQNVHTLSFEPEGLAYITPEQDREMTLSRVVKDDVLLNITGASIGRTCVVPDELCPANVNQHVSIIRVKRERLLPAFLAAFLASPEFQHHIVTQQAGATRQALTKEDIESFCVPIPTIETQEQLELQLQEKFSALTPLQSGCEEELTAIGALSASVLRTAFNGHL